MQDQHADRHSLRTILAVLLVPSILLGFAIFFGLSSTYQQYRATKQEIMGLAAIRHLYHIMSDLQLIRGLHLARAGGGSPEIETQIDALRADLLSDFEAQNLSDVNAFPGVAAEIAALLEQTRVLGAIKSGRNGSATLFSRYSQLIERTDDAIATVANQSQLVLDPELETYYLMQLSVMQIPDISEAISRLQALGVSLFTQTTISEIDRDLFHKHMVVADTLIAQLERSSTVVSAASPDLKSVINIPGRSHAAEIALRLDQCTVFPCKLKASISGDSFVAKMTEMRASFDAIFFSATDRLALRLSSRLDRHFRNMGFTLTASLGVILVSFLISSYYSRQLNASYRELERLSATDPLTGIPNRRALESDLSRALLRARRDGTSFALGMVDVDFFKLYNDTYGHQQGDEVLRAVARGLQESFQRASDQFFRYGGEEFCFYINAKSLSELDQITTNVRLAISSLALEHAKSPFGVVTVSIGAVFVPVIRDERADDLIELADQLLYRAKADGRNRCELTAINPHVPLKPQPVPSSSSLAA